jgi:ABC-2 type transport system ATP-binding protein
MDPWRVALFGERLHVMVDTDAEAGIATIANQLLAAGLDLRSAREGRFSLEDVFISVVEQVRGGSTPAA